MKTILIFTLIITCGFAAEFSYEELRFDIEAAVCDTWHGLGEVWSGPVCSASIQKSCAAIFDVIPEIIHFFTTWDFEMIRKLVDDIYVTINETIQQFHICNYTQHAIKIYEYLEMMFEFLPHIFRFIFRIPTRITALIGDIKCIISSIQHETFNEMGICIGHLLKILIDE